jgi:putative Ca2+/H+ antiporter (TMEM165/GDT1 family)
MGPQVLRWVIGLGFLAMAAWMLIPDRVEEDAADGKQRFVVFGTTLFTFFLAEMGDKTQIATVALAARYDSLFSVVAGTTLGMMLADVQPPRRGCGVGRISHGPVQERLGSQGKPLAAEPLLR